MYFVNNKTLRTLLYRNIETINELNYEKQQEYRVSIMETFFELEHADFGLYEKLLGLVYSDFIKMKAYENTKDEDMPEIELIKTVDQTEDLSDLEFQIMEEPEILYEYVKVSIQYHLMSDLEQADVNLSTGTYLAKKILKFNPMFLLEVLTSYGLFKNDISEITKKDDHEYSLDYLLKSKKHDLESFKSNLRKIVKIFYIWKSALLEHTSLTAEEENMLKRVESMNVDEFVTFLNEWPELMDYLLETYELYVNDEFIVKNETVEEETLSKASQKVINNWLK